VPSASGIHIFSISRTRRVTLAASGLICRLTGR
jgi:hypothetical protein